MQIHPLHDYVLVDVPGILDSEKKLDSGFVVTEKDEKKLPIKGKVLEIGYGRPSDTGMTIYPPSALQVGTTVFFQAYQLEKIEISLTEVHCLVKVEHIVAYANE